MRMIIYMHISRIWKIQAQEGNNLLHIVSITVLVTDKNTEQFMILNVSDLFHSSTKSMCLEVRGQGKICGHT